MGGRGHFHPDDLDEIRGRVHIDELVRETVQLRQSGSGQLAGLCPFHDERTPSFKVTPARGYYHCFGCGESGDIFDWVQKVEHVDFPDAVRWLADRAGLQLRDTGTGEVPAGPPRKRLLEAAAAAQRIFTAGLAAPVGERACQELVTRGFTAADAARHGCGVSPGGQAVTSELRRQGFTMPELAAAGLTVREGRDFFADTRLMWPLADHAGRIVGFAGRQLGDTSTGHKYVNSPAGPLFAKAQLLYWLDHARLAAARTGQLFIVEGYTDVMACVAAGVDEVVASCGTAFGEQHLQLLLRLLPAQVRIVFCFDGDKAGIDATAKAFKIASSHLHRTYAVRFPAGMDPCDLRIADGNDAVRAALTSQVPLTEQVLRDQAATLPAPTSPEARATTVRALTGTLTGVPDQVIRDGYRPLVAELAQLAVGQVGAVPGPAQDSLRPVPDAQPQSAPAVAEPAALTLMLSYPQLRPTWEGRLDPAWFTSRVGRAIAAAVQASPAEHGWERAVLEQLPDEFRKVAVGLTFADQVDDPAGQLSHCLRRLHLGWLERRTRQLRAEITQAGDTDRAGELRSQWQVAMGRLRSLKAGQGP